MFNRTVGQCNFEHLVYCPLNPTTTPEPWTPDPWTPDPWTPDPWTPDPWTPDPWTPAPPGGAEPVCAGHGQVFHAHPTDCTRFFICLDYDILWFHRCPNDLHWNQLINACDLPEYARCLAGGGGGGGGTTTTTTQGIIENEVQILKFILTNSNALEPPLWPPETTTTNGYQPWTLPALLPPRNN